MPALQTSSVLFVLKDADGMYMITDNNGWGCTRLFGSATVFQLVVGEKGPEIIPALPENMRNSRWHPVSVSLRVPDVMLTGVAPDFG